MKCWCAWPLQLPIIRELIFWTQIHLFPHFSLGLVIKKKREENFKPGSRNKVINQSYQQPVLRNAENIELLLSYSFYKVK